MSPKSWLRPLVVYLAPVLLLSALAGAGRADGPCVWCGFTHLGCKMPTTTYTRTTCFHYKCICPKPICDPCNLEHFGYYPTCWQPWPYPPDYRHCPNFNCAVAAAGTVPGGEATGAGPSTGGASPAGPMPPADERLPEPRKGNGK
jgi:hypothetical protein